MAGTDDPNLEGAQKGAVASLTKAGYSIADYRKISRLGEGTFGEVWKAERGGFAVALKILKTSMSSDETQRELKSLENLRRLHHKYLLHTENFWSDGDRLFIEMELADGGTLKERLKAYQAAGREGIPEDELLKYFTEASQALDYLHGHRPVFLHRDIKPANILLVQGCAKLADFGLLRQVTGDNTSTKTQGGTPVYMAPESIKEDRFSVHSDLFSFAVTYAELRQGKLPFFAKTQFQIYQKICQDPPELSDIFHPEERRVLLKALEKESGARYSSCGEFVFELNRVVPWVPAIEVPSLPAPLHPEPDLGPTDVRVSAEPRLLNQPEYGTSRKRSPITMEDMELPPVSAPSANAPTAKRDEGTVVNEKASRPAKPMTDAAVGVPPSVGTSDPAASLPSTASKLSKATDKKPTAAFAQAHAKARKQVLLRVLLSVVLLSILGGVGLVVILAFKDSGGPVTDKPHDDKSAKDGKNPPLSPEVVAKQVDDALEADKVAEARKIVEQNQAGLPNRGAALHDKIDKKSEVLTVLSRADQMFKKKEYENCLTYLTSSKAPFEHGKDVSRKNRLFEVSRTEMHKGLVFDLTEQIRARDPQRARETLTALLKFRKEHASVEWKPDFQELPFPNELLAAAWKSLLAPTVVPTDCRLQLEKAKEYATGSLPEKYILDAVYDKNVQALEGLVKAHEANLKQWDQAITNVIGALRENNQPGDLSRNSWLALVPLEKSRKLFRFEDLDALPTAAPDEQAKKASSELFVQVLERLVQANNYQWHPSEVQCAKLADWASKRVSAPTPRLSALKAECLVRTDAKLEAINQIGFPLKADWYGSYVNALVTHKTAVLLNDNKKYAAAADLIAGVLQEKPRVVVSPRERSKKAADILRAAVGKLQRLKGKAPEFADEKEAARALGWLSFVVELDEGHAQPTAGDDLNDLGFAAVGADSPEAGEILKKVAQGLDKLDETEKRSGYLLLARAHRIELDRATARLGQATPKNDFWDKAIAKSQRSQEFAYASKKTIPLETVADLNARAVQLEARVTFDKSKAPGQGKAKYRIFEAAIQRAKGAGANKQADAFILPLVVAALESVKDFSKEHTEATVNDGEAALNIAVPKDPWWQELRMKSMVRLADAHFHLVLKKAMAKENIDQKAEYPHMIKLYTQAKESGKQVERFKGEVPYKIGALHYALKNYNAAHKELKEAKTKLVEIPQPYPSDLDAEIRDAIAGVEELLNRPELKKLDGQQ